MVQKLVRTRKVVKVGKISGKYDILIVEEKRVSLIVNKTKIILEMTTWERDIYARRLKSSKMRIKKRIEKENSYFHILVGKYFEASYR